VPDRGLLPRGVTALCGGAAQSARLPRLRPLHRLRPVSERAFPNLVIPINTVCLPLKYSSNPGEVVVSYRGVSAGNARGSGDLLEEFMASPAGRTKEKIPSLCVVVGWAHVTGHPVHSERFQLVNTPWMLAVYP
jgi:hypothetical protein